MTDDLPTIGAAVLLGAFLGTCVALLRAPAPNRTTLLGVCCWRCVALGLWAGLLLLAGFALLVMVIG